MELEIIFHSSSTPKKISNATQLYTKGDMVCVQLDDGVIVRYPLLNIFSIDSQHCKHLGSTQKKKEHLISDISDIVAATQK